MQTCAPVPNASSSSRPPAPSRSSWTALFVLSSLLTLCGCAAAPLTCPAPVTLPMPDAAAMADPLPLTDLPADFLDLTVEEQNRVLAEAWLEDGRRMGSCRVAHDRLRTRVQTDRTAQGQPQR